MQGILDVVAYIFGQGPKRYNLLHPTLGILQVAVSRDGGKTAKFADGTVIDVPELPITGHSDRLGPDDKVVRIFED